MPDDLRRMVAEFDLAGVIYFARNIGEPLQVAELSREAAALARDWPFWISVDQEGGRVARLKAPFTIWPPAVTLGRGSTAEVESLAVRYATALASELKAVGINLDWTPVLDVNSNPSNPVIGDRSFSHDPEVVARVGAAVIRTLQAAGIVACGKHFPGHGDTSVDSHEAMPVIEHDRRRLDAVELVPFKAAIAAGVACMMTGHILVPALDERAVGTFSPNIVTGLLKGTLGFPGVVASDDMGMKAVSAETPLPEATVAAVKAGCDVVLLCNSTQDQQWEAIEALIRAAESGEIPQKRIDDAWRRQREVKERFRTMPMAPAIGIDRIGCEQHRAVAAEMAAFQ